MKVIIALTLALLALQVAAIDFTDIPQEEIDALEKAVKFNQNVADSQLANAGKGFFQSIFGSGQQENNKLQFSKSVGNKEQSEQAADKDVGQEKQISLGSDLSNLMKGLPYEALLPRRRKTSSPLDLIGSLLKQDDEDESQDNPLKELDQLLRGRQKKNKGKKLSWQNPDFKEGKSEIPFTKIFGAKSRGQHGVHVKEEDIQRMLETSMPNLKGGKIIKLSQASYRRGIYLNIEYQTAKEQIYTIKAKYVRRTNELEIISLNEINIMKKVDPQSDNDDAVQIEEKPVVKETPKVEELLKVEKKVEAEAKPEEKVEETKEKTEEPKVEVEVKKEQPVAKEVEAPAPKEEAKPVEKPVEAKKTSQLQKQPEETQEESEYDDSQQESKETNDKAAPEAAQPTENKPKAIESN